MFLYTNLPRTALQGTAGRRLKKTISYQMEGKI